MGQLRKRSKRSGGRHRCLIRTCSFCSPRCEGVGLGWHGVVNGEVVRLGPTVSDQKALYFLQHRFVRDESGVLARMLTWFENAASEWISQLC